MGSDHIVSEIERTSCADYRRSFGASIRVAKYGIIYAVIAGCSIP